MQHNFTQDDIDRAYASGVNAVLDLALKAADACDRMELHSTRRSFASAALRALTVEGRGLLPIADRVVQVAESAT